MGPGVFGGDFPPRRNVTLGRNSSNDGAGDGVLGITRSPCAVSLLDFPLRVKPLSAVEMETSRWLTEPEKFEALGSRVLVTFDVLETVLGGSFGTGSFVDIQLSFSADSSVWFVNDDCGRLSAGFDLALIDRL